MDIYKEASKKGLRVPTTKGNLSVEQLWGLPLTELDTLAVKLQEAYESSKGKSFLVKKTVKDKDLKLQFDIVLDILETMVAERDAANEAREIKEHNEKILNIIAEKKDEALKGKSVAQLMKELR